MTLKEQLEAELKEARESAGSTDKTTGYDDYGGWYEFGYRDGLERAMELLNELEKKKVDGVVNFEKAEEVPMNVGGRDIVVEVYKMVD